MHARLGRFKLIRTENPATLNFTIINVPRVTRCPELLTANTEPRPQEPFDTAKLEIFVISQSRELEPTRV